MLQIATSAVRLALQGAKRVDLKIANVALKEMRYAFKIFTPYRRVRKVTVFGSARTGPSHGDYDRAVELGRRMASAGWMVVTGAGSGIMGAAHAGAGREMSFGVNIRLPFEQQANRTIRGDPKLMVFRYFFTRKLFLLKESSAIVLFPGGFGTLDETFEVLTLLQTGKQPPIPVVMVENPRTRYFAHLKRFVEEQILAEELISPHDAGLFRVVESVEDACQEVFRFYRLYHSSRYVGDKLMVRLERALTKEELTRLNASFGNILRSGRIESAPVLPEERDDPQLAKLARIQFDFNRRDLGRLRQLIDVINAFA
ncbi:MAG: TIGR00730 family Rossman fold protein [Acidobacteriota bacterium]